MQSLLRRQLFTREKHPAARAASFAIIALGSRTASFAAQQGDGKKLIRIHEPPVVGWEEMLKQEPAPGAVGSMLFTRIAPYAPAVKNKRLLILLQPSVMNEELRWWQKRYPRPQPFSYQESVTQALEEQKKEGALCKQVGVRANDYPVDPDAEGEVNAVDVAVVAARPHPQVARLLSEAERKFSPFWQISVKMPAQTIHQVSLAVFYRNPARFRALRWMWFEYDTLREYCWNEGVLEEIRNSPHGSLLRLVEHLPRRAVNALDTLFWSDARRAAPREWMATLKEALAQWSSSLEFPAGEETVVVVAPSLFWERVLVDTLATERGGRVAHLAEVMRLVLPDELRVDLAPLQQEPPVFLGTGASIMRTAAYGED